MYDDFDFQREWKECAGYAKLAEKWKPFTPKQFKEALLDYYSPDGFAYSDLETKVTYPISRRKQKLKDEIVYRNLRFIIKKAKSPQHTGKGIPLIELIQEAIMGFIHSLDKKYNITKGTVLLTNAGWWILQFLTRSLENKSKIVRLPQHTQGRINKIRAVYRSSVSDKDGAKPSPEEVSILIKDKYNLDISPEEVEELGRYQYVHSSLDDTVDDGQASMLDFITTNGSDEIHEEVELAANKDYVHALLKKLDPQEAKLITWKFGLIDLNTKRTNKEMATILGLSTEQYKQLENNTMAKLRSIAEIDKVCW